MHEWSPDLAYAIGLITTDGCLSKDGRHIDLTSKDVDQIKTFAQILGLKNKIGIKSRSILKTKKYFRIQFGSVEFYRFLLKIGLTPNKSKTIKAVDVPDKYFGDFLRGCLDGDGCILYYFDKKWKNSFVLYTVFSSASVEFLQWLKETLRRLYKVEGAAVSKMSSRCHQLRYAKKASLTLIKKMYYKGDIPCLGRKRSKIELALGIIQERGGGEMADAYA